MTIYGFKPTVVQILCGIARMETPFTATNLTATLILAGVPECLDGNARKNIAYRMADRMIRKARDLNALEMSGVHHIWRPLSKPLTVKDFK